MGIAASEDIGESADTANAFTSSYHYYHGNERMDVEYITDESGNVVNSYAYDAFGSIISSSETIPNRYTYNGEAYDKATEQYYLRKRYYNPKLSRFIQEDDYRGDGLNLYAFCANNPVMYVDPSGYSQVFPSDIYPPGTDVDIYVDSGRVSIQKTTQKKATPGIVTGNFTSNIPVSGGRISSPDGSVIAIPQEVAQQLVGKQYSSFDEFRSDLWKAIGNSSYSNEFKQSNVNLMKAGKAPFAIPEQWCESGKFQGRFSIDHIIEVQDGGYVYDLDNMTIRSPKNHDEKTKAENEARKQRKCNY